MALGLGRSARFRLTLTALLGALVFGGASRFDILSPMLAEAIALLVIALLVGSGLLVALTRLEKTCWALLFAIFAVQLVPLPYDVWSGLPGHGYPRDIFKLLGLAPWLPLTLTPSRTFASLFALFPPLAVYLGARGLTRAEGDRVLLWLVGFAAASALLGLFQVAGGQGTALRFYAITNRDAAVGFFSNANHFGVWLAACVPAAAYLALGKMNDDPRGRRTIALAAAGFIALLALGAVASFSRAAYGAILVAVIFSASALVFRSHFSRPVKMGIIAGGLLLLVAAMAIVVGSGAFERIAEVSDMGQRGRLGMVPIYLRIIGDVLPLGTGVGSFDAVNRGYEDYSVLGSTYLNNAHNDLAQIAIETGVLGLVALGFWLFHIARSSRAALHDSGEGAGMSLGKVRAIALILPIFILLSHSLVDYPLRSNAAAATFALFVALLAGTRRNPHS